MVHYIVKSNVIDIQPRKVQRSGNPTRQQTFNAADPAGVHTSSLQLPAGYAFKNRPVSTVFYQTALSEAHLGPRFDLGGSAANALSLGALQMRGGDPALVVLRAAGDSRAVSTNDSDLLSRIDLLGALRRLLSALATLAATLLLGEEGADPGVVDEVDGSSESTEEDKVKEDAGFPLAQNHLWRLLVRSGFVRELTSGDPRC